MDGARYRVLLLLVLLLIVRNGCRTANSNSTRPGTPASHSDL